MKMILDIKVLCNSLIRSKMRKPRKIIKIPSKINKKKLSKITMTMIILGNNNQRREI